MELDTALQAAAAVAGAAAIGGIVSRRLPIPLPVFLLVVGIILGRDGFGVVQTDEIAFLVRVSVAVAVAVIVFEGGTALDFHTIRLLAPAVRNLVIGGLIVTPLVGMLAAHYILDFPWRVAALFGALVCVTGPSVITPLLRAVRVNDRLRTILMSEGVIIDPFGALLTLFLLQIALAESLDPGGPAVWVINRIVTGVLCGAGGAAFVYFFPRVVKRLSSREVSLLVIASAVATFAVAESIGHESGLVAMVVMGIALGSLEIPHRDAMHEFQESIVAFLVATVYVLLAASISLESVVDLGWRGILVVLILAVIGRPLLVALAFWRSGIPWREQVFVGAVGPRGVVAASLAGVVALETGGSLGGDQEAFVAMVFVVIILTIGVQSAYARPLARYLRVMPVKSIVAGGGEVGMRVAARFQSAGEPVLIIESDEAAALEAREAGFEVLIGDAGSAETLKKAGLRDARAFILATPSDDRNLLAAQLARSAFGVTNVYARVNDPANVPAFTEAGVAVVSPQEAVAQELADIAGVSPLSDVLAPVDKDLAVIRVTVTNPAAQRPLQSIGALRGTVIIMVRRGTTSVIPTGKTTLRLGDVVTLIGRESDRRKAQHGLTLDASATALGSR